MEKPVFHPRPSEGLNHANVVQMLAARVAKTPDLPALRHKEGGAWRTLSWSQWQATAREIAAALTGELKVQRGDRVAIMAPTRLEWTLLDTAIAMAGAVSVPIYPSLTADHTTFILKDAGCVAVVTEHPEHIQRILNPEFAERIQGIRHIVHLEDRYQPPPGQPGPTVTLESLPAGGPQRMSWAAFRQAGAAKIEEYGPRLDEIATQVGIEDELTYVYTSGTTGLPKGVVLLHRNLIYESWAIRNTVPVDETDEQLLILPLAHIFARHLVFAAMETGIVSSFAESIEKTAANLQEVAPTFMGAVPRVYEKIYNKIMADVAEGSAVKQRIFHWCLDVGRKVSVCRQRGQAPPTGLALKMAVADRIVFSKIKQVFGGRLRFFVSGGAPLSKEIAEFFHAAGILILEGYGLTETSAATNVNRPDRYRFGTVGPALPGCEIRIADDGEILVRGHNVMQRYHNLPDETREVLDDNGWFHTGDIGELNDGFLRITDRKKDLIKTAGGKYIAPQLVENKLKVKEGVSQVVVIGDGRPYAVALVTLDEPAALKIGEREGLGTKSYEDLVRHPRIREIVQGYVDEVNAGLASFETVKRFAIPGADFTEQTGELTPTLKVRRKAVAEKYRDLIEGLYADGKSAKAAS